MDIITPGLGIIFWQTITFIVVLIVLKKFAWKTIINSIKTRENRVQGALNSAKEAKRQLDLLQEKSKQIIDEATLEGERIMKEGISSKEQIVKQAKFEAKRVTEEELNRAKKLIEKEKNIALIEMRNKISDLVIDLSEKLLMEKLKDPEEQTRIINKMIEDMPEAS
ncbi:MAG: F0F1 ATP synthase subunit B [Bacteroidetes bacterium]|nr:F0F1 ATP synthase subunit B [Bacteroidota bacterium]